jgi:DegV family protein with EDD domain
MEENKLPIGLVVDEVADLPQSIVEENDIGVVKFKIDLQEIGEIPGNTIYEKIREAERRGIKSLVKTSQPSINDFLAVFKEKLQKFEEVICIAFSSRISGACNSAMQAKKFLSQELQNKVHIIDSFTGSAGQGLVCLETLNLIKQKFNVNEVINRVIKELPRFKLLGMYKEAKWLEASGRIPKIGSLAINQAEKMSIRPMFGMKDGKLSIVGIKRNIKDISSAMFEDFEKQTQKTRQQGNKIIAAITHADDIVQAEKLKNLILTLKNAEVSYINLVCFPVGGHIGPNSIVLAWKQ